MECRAFTHRVLLAIIGVFVGFFSVGVRAQNTQPIASDWLKETKPILSGDEWPFQFRFEINIPTDQLIGYISWAPPDRRCVILCDRIDGVPLMIAVDGMIWFYDPISGGILRARGEPTMIARDDLDITWGSRSPDSEPKDSIRLDFRSLIDSVSRQPRSKVERDDKSRTIKVVLENMEMIFESGEAGSDLPRRFIFKADGYPIIFDSFTRSDKLPTWHRSVVESELPKDLRLVIAEEVDSQPLQVRANATTFYKLLTAGYLYILRPALRDPELQRAFEPDSPVKLDFNSIRKNDAAMRDRWKAAIIALGYELPLLNPTTQPATESPK